MRGSRSRCLWLLGVLLAAVLAPPVAAAERPPDVVVEDVEVESRDGTLLRGHVVRPAGRERVPVVLWSTPYAGNLDPEVHDSTTPGGRDPVVPVDLLLEEGYAVAQFHVRGTGDSGGCFDLAGKAEQEDQRVLVDWLAERGWSSGKVGMVGQSYDAITALSAAVAAPAALRTIVVSGVLTDVYTTAFSPQGAVMDDQSWTLLAGFYGGLSAAPPRPVLGDDPVSPYVHHLQGLADPRFCPEALDALTRVSTDTFASERQAAFFEERRLLPRLGSVRAAVLQWHGFQDHLAFEEDRVWEALTSAPKWQWQGQWAHATDPLYNHREDLLLPWLDHWLKGGPAPRGLGRVDYEVGHGEGLNTEGAYAPGAEEPPGDWRRSSAWPPAEAVQTTLHLRRDGLGADPDRDGTRAFHALPDASKRHPTIDARTYPPPVVHAPPCPGDGATALVYESEPMTTGTTVAGNPRARLLLESDRPAGSFSLQLFALGPEYDCAAGRTTDYRFLTEGGVDLRFVRQGWDDPWYVRDRYTARPFPTGTAVPVRVDLQSLAEHLPAGSRLAAVLSAGPQHARTVQGVAAGSFPRLTVHGTSALDLPLVQGAVPG